MGIEGRRWVALVVAAGIWLAAAGPASAARGPEAEALYEEAKAAMKQGEPATALARFERLLVLVEGDERETWQMLLGVGLAQEHLGRLPLAIEAYRRFLDRSEAHPTVLDDDGRDPWEFRGLCFQMVTGRAGGAARARCEGGSETLA